MCLGPKHTAARNERLDPPVVPIGRTRICLADQIALATSAFDRPNRPVRVGSRFERPPLQFRLPGYRGSSAVRAWSEQ